MTRKTSHLLAAPRAHGHNQETRRQGSIPAVLYGYGLNNINIQIDSRKFSTVFNNAGYTSLITLTVQDEEQNKEHTVLIRDLQMHPLKSTVLHVDFYQPRLDQAITANVPLNFIGEAPAVKDLGGVLVRTLDEVELEALPTDLPHDISVDITVLTNFSKSIYIHDLVLPPKVKLHHEPDETVALVKPPRTEAELEELEGEVKEDVESVEGVEDKVEETDAGEGEAEATDKNSSNKDTSSK